jgi:hypothetical protein
MAKPTPDNEPEPEGNRRGAVAGLIFAVVLLAVGLWLARELRSASQIQDCEMTGRSNFDPIETPAR